MRSTKSLYLALLGRAAQRAGLRLTTDEPESADVRWRQMLEDDGVSVVVDVGANIGQSGDALRGAGWLGQIISFEPQSKPFEALRKKVAQDDAWDAYQLALGAEDTTVHINLASIHPRSSLLPLTEVHLNILPDSTYVGTEEVPCKRLDDALAERIPASAVIALKMDVQGYELEVLKGAPRTLERARLVKLEVLLVNLYDGQPTPAQLMAFLDESGFELVSAEAESIDPRSGRMNWLNVVFRRCDSP